MVGTKLFVATVVFIHISGTLLECLEAYCPTSVVRNRQKGDGHCDSGCMSPACAFDSANSLSDCQSLCTCSSQLSNSICDLGTLYLDCNSLECEWDGGDCGYCSPGCWERDLGDGRCDPLCDTEWCYWDMGDCVTEGSPVEVYVTAKAGMGRGRGTWTSPFTSIVTAIQTTWASFTVLYLLTGTHYLQMEGVTSTRILSIPTPFLHIQTLYCANSTSDHPECSPFPSTLQLTSSDLNFLISSTLLLSNVTIKGGFSLVSNCTSDYCTYCPSVHFNDSTGRMNNDRNEVIEKYASQGLCDVYRTSALFQLQPESAFILTNVLFDTIRHQPMALITNQCGNLTLTNVTFTNITPRKVGLAGGIIQQLSLSSYDPYYCGSFSYSTGVVELLNNGYEYSQSNLFSGFAWLTALHSIHISNVTFQYNYMQIGKPMQIYGSSLMFIRRFRYMEVVNCRFRYNVADTGAGFYIYTALNTPLVVENGIAVEENRVHLRVQGNFFERNTGREGSVIYIRFMGDHQNIEMRNNTFRENFATEGGVLVLDFGDLTDKSTTGQNITAIVKGTLQSVFIPPITTLFHTLSFLSNYAPVICAISNVANFLLLNTTFIDDGDSLSGLTAYELVVGEFAANTAIYMSLPPPKVPADACSSTFLVQNSYNVTVKYVLFQALLCSHGSPGFSLSGSTQYMEIEYLESRDSLGYGLLALVTGFDLRLNQLVFVNNTNIWDENSVCLDISQTTPSTIDITNSIFEGNSAVFGTLAKVKGAKKVVLTFIKASSNVAKSTSAGILFTPLVDMDSSLTVEHCLFLNNTSLRSGVVLITETSGSMLLSAKQVTVTMRNNTFENNYSKYGGCALSIAGFVVLSQDNVISENVYRNNQCEEGGAALYGTFVAGILRLERCTFEGNSGLTGTAVYSTHQGSTTTPTYLSISHSTFTNNTGASIISISGSNFPLFLTSNNLFQQNHGGLSLTATQWLDSDSYYEGNTDSEGGVFTALDFSTITLTNLTAVSNHCSVKGAVASISMHSIVTCTHCVFRYNKADTIGGVVASDQQSRFECEFCQFGRNYAESGAGIYAIFSEIAIINSTINDNFASDYGSIVLIESSFSLFSSEMTHNTASNRSPGIISSLSDVTILSSTLHHQVGYTGSLIFASVSSNILMEKCEVYECSGVSGGVVYIAINSTLTVLESDISACSASSDGGILQSRGSTIIFLHSVIHTIKSPLGNGAVYVLLSRLNATNTTFTGIIGSTIIAQSSYISLDTVHISDVTAGFGSGVNCIDCYSLYANNSRFEGNTAKLGGAVYSFTAGFLSGGLVTVLENNVFVNNTAANGGAVYSNSVQLELFNNSFEGNTAKSLGERSDGLRTVGVGGAVYCVCEFIPFCDFRISKNRFEGNRAEQKGGGLYWFDSYPTLSTNEMKSNAAVYGSDIASFPIRLSPYSPSLGLGQYLSNDSTPLTGSVRNIASGQVSVETLQYALVDHYDNVVVDDSDSSAQIVAAEGNLTVTGNTQVVAVEGVFTFTKLTFKAQPTSQQSFQVTTAAIDRGLKTYTRDPHLYIPTVEVRTEFRDCKPGESLQNMECYICPEGTFSLDPAEPCNSCPSNVICYGNFTMVPEPGYWRPDPSLNLFFQCPNKAACIGSPLDRLPLSLTGLCATGYSGNLCSVCASDYSLSSRHTCSVCPSLTANLVVSVLVVVVALALGACAIVISIRSATRPRSELAIHLKIFMNYLQMVVVAASLNLNWPVFVSLFLNGQDTAGSVSEQFFSFDCILQKVHISSVFYTKMIGNAVLPACLLAFAGLIWVIITLFMRMAQILSKLIASLVMILFILHPSLTKSMFSFYSCTQVKPGELWLTADLSLRCWSAEHIKYTLSLSVSSIVVWIIGLPLVCLSLLYRYRTRLSDPSTQLRFSFLYKGYQPQWYFWEFVILYRKVALVSASVFLSTVSILIQALSVLAVLLCSLYFQLQFLPFATPVFNRLELKSILVSTVTIYAGLFYQTDDICKSYLAAEVTVLLFVVILSVNAYFLFSWIREVFPLIINVLKRRFKRNYRVRPIVKKNGKTEEFGSIEDFVSENKTQRVSFDSGEISAVTPISLLPPDNSPCSIHHSQPEAV